MGTFFNLIIPVGAELAHPQQEEGEDVDVVVPLTEVVQM